MNGRFSVALRIFWEYLVFHTRFQIHFNFFFQDDLQSVYTPSQTHTLFLTLFRTLLPDLYAHFEDEDVISDNNSSWSYLWITGLLAKELPIECVARLWDTYFSIDVNFFGDLHVYVCLAILSFLKDNLEELEQSEISGTLGRLPLLDMDHVKYITVIFCY